MDIKGRQVRKRVSQHSNKYFRRPLLILLGTLLFHKSFNQDFVGTGSVLDGGEYAKSYVDITKGLSNNFVSKIACDRFGMMWFATEGGVNRYDGENVKIIKPSNRYAELLNENIETLFIDSNGYIWVGTKSGGVSRYDQALDQFTNFNDVLRPDHKASVIRITDIAEDEDGNIWIATWGLGLFKLSHDYYKLEGVFLENKVIQEVCVDHFGNVWSISNNYLHKFDPSENRMIDLKKDFGTGMALCYDDENKQLLIGASKGLFKFDIDNYILEEFSESKRLQLERINAISIDQSGRIWVGSWSQGLHVSTPDRSQMQKFPLVSKAEVNTSFEIVLDVFITQSNQVWVASGYGGVARLSPTRSITHVLNTSTNEINLHNNNIQSITKDSRGAIWCGTWRGGIAYSEDGINYQKLPGIKDNKVATFMELDGQMLVGTAAGLFFYEIDNPMAGAKRRVFATRKIKEIFVDSRQRLWIGTQQYGLFLFDYWQDKTLEKRVRYHPQSDGPEGLESERISKILEDSQHNIWIGTYNGLYRFSEQDSTFIRKDHPELFPSVIVLTLHVSEDNDFWIGMPGGLLRASIQKGELRPLKLFTSAQGLQNDYITAVTSDKLNNIWLSNTSGIATIRAKNDAIINMSVGEGYSYSMNINSYFNDGEKIFFGGSNGFYYFDPLQIDLLTDAPRPIFDRLKIDNDVVRVGDKVNDRAILKHSMAYTEEIEISHQESIVTIGFIPGDLQDRQNLRYFYRIKGLQDNWIDNSSNSEVNFIGLDAGKYVLELKSTRDQINFSEISRMKLNVLPPPWLSSGAYLTYVITFILLVVLVNRFLVNRANLKSNLAMAKLSKEKEHDLNEAKLRFFTNISHELRTPLTLIISPIAEVLQHSKLHSDLKERLSYVETNANKLLDLINQLLDFRKAEQGELELKVAKGNFVKFAKEIFLTFKGYAETQGVNYEFECSSDSLDMTYDRDKMEMVLCNLLSNAFKFTSQKGRVFLSLSSTNEGLIITVGDTGKGISKEYQDKIFNRFFQIQGSESSKVVGSGIGLSLSYRIVKLHHGTIEVSSKSGQGTTFIVTIPKGEAHFGEEQLIADFQDSERIDRYTLNQREDLQGLDVPSKKSKSKVNLLIVDDNKDILGYLKALFLEESYEVLTASNGLEAKELAIRKIPDLIISDVMMPELDGIELCGILKDDIRTSHIPIILLTARTSTVYEVDGLDTGADDYVRKPFDAEVIKARVVSLLQNRSKVRSHLINQLRFKTDVVIKPENREEKFIQDLSSRVEGSLQDSSFSIDILAEELCMSQSTLYRKIKSLTGLSIAGFIRSVRLKKATEILISENIKLSAVAYSVGFNDYKYFNKSFTEQYGISPKEYREQAFNSIND
ncbi:MAG: two-component regulator propeller domain-containing protein [Bacteroidota bacterium]